MSRRADLPLPDGRDVYVRKVLAAYLAHGAAVRVRAADRRLAGELHERAVPLAIVEAALLLATARRARRPSEAPPLAAVRSLHYYLPVIEELLANPPDPAYVRYLADVLAGSD